MNSFDQIIDKVSNYSTIDGIFVKLFKTANYFYFHLEHLKKVEKLNSISLNVCVENQLNNLQLIEIYFWANDDFLKLQKTQSLREPPVKKPGAQTRHEGKT